MSVYGTRVYCETHGSEHRVNTEDPRVLEGLKQYHERCSGVWIVPEGRTLDDSTMWRLLRSAAR